MTKWISENERMLLRVTFDVARAVEERMVPLRSVFFAEADDLEIIDLAEPFKQICDYYGIPYLTEYYCRDELSDHYFKFVDGNMSADELIDKIAEHIEWLANRHAEVGDAVTTELSFDEYNAIMMAELKGGTNAE